MTATRPKRSIRSRASGAAQPPAGGRRLAMARIPPAHIPADSTCTTASRSGLTRIEERANTRSPSTPTTAAATATHSGGCAQAIFGFMPPRRITTSEPIAPRSPRYSSQWNAAATRSGSACDRASTQHPAARVEDRGLAGRRAKERFVEPQPAVGVGRRDRRRVVAKPDLARQRSACRAVDERHVLEGDLAHRELLSPADDDSVRGRVDAQHVPGAGLDEAAEARALADGVEGGSAVSAELAAARVDDLARPHRQSSRQVRRGLATRHKADLLALRLVRDRQPELASVLTHLGLGHLAQWKDDACQALPVEVVQHVGLVLRGIGRGVELAAAQDARVVAGGEPVEAQLENPREHQVEPYEGVAAHAWVGRAAFEIGAVEGLDHALTELLLQAPTVIRNVEQRCFEWCGHH